MLKLFNAIISDMNRPSLVFQSILQSLRTTHLLGAHAHNLPARGVKRVVETRRALSTRNVRVFAQTHTIKTELWSPSEPPIKRQISEMKRDCPTKIYPLWKGYQGSAQTFLPVAFRANISCTGSDATRPLGVAVLTHYVYVRSGFDLYRNLGGPLAV